MTAPPNEVFEAARALARLDVETLVLPVLLQLAVIIAAARTFGALARKCGQPSVVGEIAAGLLLGPSLLGWLFPDTFTLLFQPELPGIGPSLSEAALTKIVTVIAQLGLIFLMFLVGLELEPGHIRKCGPAVIAIATAGIVVPFVLGMALTPLIHPHLEPHPRTGVAAPSSQVAIFIGLTLAVTAIPVLGRIMIELNLTRTRVGAVTLAAAAVSDAGSWILLAMTAALVRSDFDPLQTLRMAGLTTGFVIVMWLVVRPLLVQYFVRSLKANDGQLNGTPLAVLLVSVLLSAVATNVIGIFAVFGAFLLGAVLSDQTDLHRAVHAKLHDIVNSFFVPVFFTYTGLRTNISTIGGGMMWLICAAMVVLAVVGKLLGCGLAAWTCGFTRKESAIIGALMNARGLMALIVINLGHELGVVPPSLYCILVIMALATTVLTTPLLLLVRKGTEIEEPMARSGFFGSPPSQTAETSDKPRNKSSGQPPFSVSPQATDQP